MDELSSGIRMAQVDAVDFLASRSPSSVDCCITDPAYESLEKHRKRGTTTRLKKSEASSNAWFEVFENERFDPLFDELYRVLVPASHAWIFCDETTADVLKPVVRRHGFWVWKSLIWVKTVQTATCATSLLEGLGDLESVSGAEAKRRVASHIDVPDLMDCLTRAGNGYHGAASCERILLIEKRSARQTWPRDLPTGRGRQLSDLSMKDVLYAPRASLMPWHDEGGVYPTEKPCSIVQRLLTNSTVSGETCIDPFAGSGVLAEAAMRSGRQALLSDIAKRSQRVTRARVEWVRAQSREERA